MPKTVQPKYNAPALDKGLDIIEYLSKEAIPLSQIEIAQGINRTPSEIYRMLVCLEERGYIIRSADAGKYRLSLKMYSLSHRHTPFDELKLVAQYPMQQLSSITRQSCHLSIMHNEQLMIISQLRSPGAVSLSIEEGTLFPLSMTTSGKVLLSMISAKKRKEILSRDSHFKKWSKKLQKELLESIELASIDGYSYSNSKLTSGVTDIAVPIATGNTELNSVLAISILTSNLEKEIDVKEILKPIKEAQNQINKLIGM